MKQPHFLFPAEQEMIEAALYYESQAKRLGQDFLAKVDSAANDIAANPEVWPIIRFDIRRCLIHRFPYAILYKVEPGKIVIVAVMHLHRHPNYWLNRIVD